MKISLSNALLLLIILCLIITHPALLLWLVSGALIVALLISIGVFKVTLTIEENKEQRKSTHF